LPWAEEIIGCIYTSPGQATDFFSLNQVRKLALFEEIIGCIYTSPGQATDFFSLNQVKKLALF
jgi:hypothetical protein